MEGELYMIDKVIDPDAEMTKEYAEKFNKKDIIEFTNLSHDHLDYHKNLKNYLDAKLYLFKKLIKKNRSVIADNEIAQFKKLVKINGYCLKYIPNEFKEDVNLALSAVKQNGLSISFILSFINSMLV